MICSNRKMVAYNGASGGNRWPVQSNLPLAAGNGARPPQNLLRAAGGPTFLLQNQQARPHLRRPLMPALCSISTNTSNPLEHMDFFDDITTHQDTCDHTKKAPCLAAGRLHQSLQRHRYCAGLSSMSMTRPCNQT